MHRETKLGLQSLMYASARSFTHWKWTWCHLISHMHRDFWMTSWHFLIFVSGSGGDNHSHEILCSCRLPLVFYGVKGFMLTTSPSITALTQGWGCHFAGSTSVIYGANKDAVLVSQRGQTFQSSRPPDCRHYVLWNDFLSCFYTLIICKMCKINQKTPLYTSKENI